MPLEVRLKGSQHQVVRQKAGILNGSDGIDGDAVHKHRILADGGHGGWDNNGIEKGDGFLRIVIFVISVLVVQRKDLIFSRCHTAYCKVSP
ncbi:hypothetical protein SDC9_172133 [bioreactor metagenome]|uniref:Uncharacterized protein n=1 Tax=bioreactor metagenome TaxID=1076179 RepID=A0A645GCU6_9ZZZZ